MSKINTFKRDFDNINESIKFLKDKKKDFSIENSNYTTTINYLNGYKDKFIEKPMAKTTFIACNKIKSDIKSRGIDIDNILQENGYNDKGVYYNSLQGISDFEMNTIFNLDLKNAYPQTLLNFNLISKETFDYLNGLNKGDKLAALGMLASQKFITHFKEGIPQRLEVVTSPYRPIFMLLVKKVDEVMTQVSRLLKDDFIFFWVDGIYLKPNNEFSVFNVQDFLKENGYNSHFETLSNFKLKRKNEKIKIQFEKGDGVKKFHFQDKNINFAVNNLINNYNRMINNDRRFKK